MIDLQVAVGGQYAECNQRFCKLFFNPRGPIFLFYLGNYLILMFFAKVNHIFTPFHSFGLITTSRLSPITQTLHRTTCYSHRAQCVQACCNEKKIQEIEFLKRCQLKKSASLIMAINQFCFEWHTNQKSGF